MPRKLRLLRAICLSRVLQDLFDRSLWCAPACQDGFARAPRGATSRKCLERVHRNSDTLSLYPRRKKTVWTNISLTNIPHLSQLSYSIRPYSRALNIFRLIGLMLKTWRALSWPRVRPSLKSWLFSLGRTPFLRKRRYQVHNMLTKYTSLSSLWARLFSLCSSGV